MKRSFAGFWHLVIFCLISTNWVDIHAFSHLGLLMYLRCVIASALKNKHGAQVSDYTVCLAVFPKYRFTDKSTKITTLFLLVAGTKIFRFRGKAVRITAYKIYSKKRSQFNINFLIVFSLVWSSHTIGTVFWECCNHFAYWEVSSFQWSVWNV